MSLSIRETTDGTVLVNCFAGCGAIDVLNALGLQWTALFPPRANGAKHGPPSRSRIPARDLLEILSHDMNIVAIVAADMLDGKTIDEADWQHLAKAAARIGHARAHLR